MTFHRRLAFVAGLFGFFAALIAATGSMGSPYADTLFLPVFLAALYFGVAGGTAGGIALCGFFVLLSLVPHGHGSASAPSTLGSVSALSTLLTRCGVFLLVSVTAGVFSTRLSRTARVANRRAQRQADRATRTQWFTDTAVMMQSMADPEHMLSAALLRLGELVPGCAAILMLLDPNEPECIMMLRTVGLPQESVVWDRLPETIRMRLRDPSFSAAHTVVPEREKEERAAPVAPLDPTLEPFRGVDPGAHSRMVVSLRTLDDVMGVLYVSSPHADGLPQRDRERLVRFGEHIVYPLQRLRLQALATTDALTGLSNNRAFRRRLSEEAQRATRYSHPLSLVLIDIDHFKRVNDTRGHQAGDAILTQIGAIVRRASRGTDLPARYGGEEMAVLCPETRAAEAAQLAERIRTSVAQNVFLLPNGEQVGVTVSAGVAQLAKQASPAVGGERDLIEAADAALYAAKKAGRNRICVAPGQAADTAHG